MSFIPSEDSEHCPNNRPSPLTGRRQHGVPLSRRRNAKGQQYDETRDAYQEGECEICGVTVYSSKDAGYHAWRVKPFIIQEEDDLEDLLEDLLTRSNLPVSAG